MPKFDYLTGQKFGRLTVISFLGRIKWSYYLCKCECGKEKKVRRDHLKTGKILSCGCYRDEMSKAASVKHNQSGNPLYFVWASMMDRCYNEKFQDYKNYGGRGISVDERWHNVANFIEDVTEGYKKGLQLDRINNNGIYSKYNFKWSTRKENNRNKRTNRHLTVNGITHVVVEWHEITGINYQSILSRMNKGLIGYEALYGEIK